MHVNRRVFNFKRLTLYVRDMMEIYESFNRLTNSSFSEPIYCHERKMS